MDSVPKEERGQPARPTFLPDYQADVSILTVP